MTLIGRSIPLHKIYPYPYDRYIGHKIGPINRLLNRMELNADYAKYSPRGESNLGRWKKIAHEGRLREYRQRESDKKYYENCDDWWLRSIGRADLTSEPWII